MKDQEFQTILLVDDEDMIIDVGKAMLEQLGYHVLTAMSGELAIEAIKARDVEIDLVILDFVMPGMDGGATFDRIRELRPGMPVILSSGYAFDNNAATIVDKGSCGFLQKPFNLAELSEKLNSLL